MQVKSDIKLIASNASKQVRIHQQETPLFTLSLRALFESERCQRADMAPRALRNKHGAASQQKANQRASFN
jgi:hypothetical protein